MAAYEGRTEVAAIGCCTKAASVFESLELSLEPSYVAGNMEDSALDLAGKKEDSAEDVAKKIVDSAEGVAERTEKPAEDVAERI